MTKRITEGSMVKRNTQIISGDVDGETVMMSIESGNYHSLNPTGNRIWEILENPCTVGSIIEVLKGEYQVDDESLKVETCRFLEKLLDRNIIQIDTPETR